MHMKITWIELSEHIRDILEQPENCFDLNKRIVEISFAL